VFGLRVLISTKLLYVFTMVTCQTNLGFMFINMIVELNILNFSDWGKFSYTCLFDPCLRFGDGLGVGSPHYDVIQAGPLTMM